MIHFHSPARSAAPAGPSCDERSQARSSLCFQFLTTVTTAHEAAFWLWMYIHGPGEKAHSLFGSVVLCRTWLSVRRLVYHPTFAYI